MAANTAATVQSRWQEEFNAQNDEEARVLWEQLAEANQQVDRIKQDLKDAKQEYEAKEAAKASVQAGREARGLLRVQLLLLTLVCSIPAWSSRFRAVHHCCFLVSCSPLSKGPLVVKLFSLCWLAALRGSACFALALRSLSRLRLFLFEARLSG